jgi:NADH-quinone oxidoreductase subunit L
MVLAVGAGAPDAAIFHLATHAFFKGCLFLAAGSVIHTLHQAQTQSHVSFNVQDIRKLGGLQKKLPFTFAIFMVSGSALAGLPFFTGFLSKEAILTALSHWKGSEFSWRWLLYGTAFAVSFITVLYTFRLIWSIFRGEEKSTKDLAVLEPPLVMRAPMAATALASCWIFFSWNPFDFQGWLFNALHNGKYFHLPILTVVSAGWVLLALFTAYLTRNKTIQSPILFHALYLNSLYQIAIVNPAMRLAEMTEQTDRKWIDGILHTGAYTQLILAHVTGWFDRVIIDGTVDGVAGMARGIGAFTRSFQGGKIQLYIFWAIFAIIIFIIWTLL